MLKFSSNNAIPHTEGHTKRKLLMVSIYLSLKKKRKINVIVVRIICVTLGIVPASFSNWVGKLKI